MKNKIVDEIKIEDFLKEINDILGINLDKKSTFHDISQILTADKSKLDDDRVKAVFDRYLKGEITANELHNLLMVIQPKQLKPESEFTGYT